MVSVEVLHSVSSFCHKWQKGFLLGILFFAPFFSTAENDDQVNLYQPKNDEEFIYNRVLALVDSAQYFKNHDAPGKALACCYQALKYDHLINPASLAYKRLHEWAMFTLFNLHSYEEAIKHTEFCLDHLALTGQKISLESYYMHSTMAQIYIESGYLDSAIVWYKKAQKVAILIEPVYYASTWNNIGMAYEKDGQLDSARFYYDKALGSIAWNDEERGNLWVGIMDNIALLERKLGNNEKAFLTSEKVLVAAQKLPVWHRNPRRVLRWCYTALDLSMDLNKLDRTAHFLKLAQGRLDFDEAKLGISIWEFRKNLFERYRRYYQMTGQIEMEVKYQELEMQSSDSLLQDINRREENQLTVINKYHLENLDNALEMEELKLERKENQLQLSEQSAALQSLWILLISGGSVLVFLFSFLFYRKIVREQRAKQQITALELKNKELESQRLKSDLEAKKKDLTNVAIDNSMQRERLNTMMSQVDNIRDLDPNQQAQALRQLKVELTSQSQVDDQLALIQTNVEKINQEFNQTLLKAYPKLTKLEREICGYIRLDLSGSEIANLRKVSPNSIKQIRHRLRKKLDLETGADLYRFIQEI